MSRFRPVKQFRVSGEVCEQLKQSTLVGHFKAGDRLPSERDEMAMILNGRIERREVRAA